MSTDYYDGNPTTIGNSNNAKLTSNGNIQLYFLVDLAYSTTGTVVVKNAAHLSAGARFSCFFLLTYRVILALIPSIIAILIPLLVGRKVKNALHDVDTSGKSSRKFV